MSNPGFIRYLTAAINILGALYLIITGEALPESDATAITTGVNGTAAAALATFNAAAMIYSKLVPSQK